MKKKITTEEEFFANNPSARKDVKQEKLTKSTSTEKKLKNSIITNNFIIENKKENKTNFKNIQIFFFNKYQRLRLLLFFSQKKITPKKKKLKKSINSKFFRISFLKKKWKRKINLNRNNPKEIFNRVKKIKVLLFFSKKKWKGKLNLNKNSLKEIFNQGKKFRLYLYFFRKNIKLQFKCFLFFFKKITAKKTNFVENIVTGGLVFSLLLFAIIFFVYHQIVYKEKEKELAQLQKTLTYLESKEKEVQQIQGTFYQEYDKLENNIEEILKKINIKKKFLKITSTNSNIKVLLLNASSINYEQLIQLIYEIENSSPTMIISNLVIAINAKGGFNVSMNITGLF